MNQKFPKTCSETIVITHKNVCLAINFSLLNNKQNELKLNNLFIKISFPFFEYMAALLIYTCIYVNVYLNCFHNFFHP